MTNKTEAIRNAQEVVALLEREGNAKAANSVRAIIQERVYIDGLAKEYYDKLSEYVKHFDQKEQELRDRQAQLSAAPSPPEREPLTDEQICAIAANPICCPAPYWWLKDEVVLNDVRNGAITFARAIERAQGIGGTDAR